MTSVGTNIGSLTARAHALASADRQKVSMNRLASGKRINNASDDAAGLAVANKMLSQLTSMQIALRNMMDGVSLIQTASSAVSEITNIVIRMRELAIQNASGVFTSSDRENAQLEIRALLNEIAKTSNSTNFNDVKLLDGSYQKVIRAGHSNAELIDLSIRSLGIEAFIGGSSFADLVSTKTILAPNVLAYGTSALNYLAATSATGTSTLNILNSSTASGVSQHNRLTQSTALGTDAFKYLTQTSALGTSSFETPVDSSASGTSVLDYRASTAASGLSSFNTPATSAASGTSAIQINGTSTATGNSQSNYLSSSRAAGSSQLNYIASAVASGASSFNTPSTSTASGTSTLTVASANQATSLNTGDTATSSTAAGTSERVIKNSSIANGSSNLNYLNRTEATGSSVISGIPTNSVASVSSASRLDPFNFNNGNFTSGGSGSAGASGGTASIQGWDIHLKQVSIGAAATNLNKTIAGYSIPVDSSAPNNVGDGTAVSQFDTTPIQYSYNAGSGSITLQTSDVVTTPNGQMHGPYIVSKEAIELNANDTVYFDWQATGSGDRADVYAYLLNVDDGSTVQLLNHTAADRGSTPISRVNRQLSSSEAGNYKFVFISGSYDADGGGKLGSGLILSNIGVTQADPTANKITTAKTTFTAQESQSVSINTSQIAQLKRISDANPGGSYRILSNGSDYWRFTLGADNNISSSPLLRSTKNSYSFDIEYTTNAGIKHTETVNVNLTTAQGATSVLSAQESDRVTIPSGRLNLMSSFASSKAGVYSLDTSEGDHNFFTIDASNGEIRSRSGLDFDVKKTYNFKALYTPHDGSDPFVNIITLNLTDTLSSSASVKVEESHSVTIPASVLSTVDNFALEDQKTGYFVLSGADAGIFNINRSTGEITSAPGQSLLLANKATYNITSTYVNASNIRHSENINLSLTEAVQASSNLEANQAQSITLNPATLSKIYGYAQRNGPGSYSFASTSGDSTFFNIDSNDGTITSKTNQINSSVKDTFNFGVVFTPSGGAPAFTETINLKVLSASSPLSAFKATEADTISMAITDMSALANFVANNGPGAYQITGRDAALFEYDQANNVIKNRASTNLKFGNTNTYNYDRDYEFNVIFTPVSGGSHTEKINLKVTESLLGTSTLTAHESGQVTINTNTMTDLMRFKSRDRNAGRFSFANLPDDNGKFSINATTGEVTSNTALDFSTQQSYAFKILYTAASDGRQFSQSVTLNLNDTLQSTANLSAEETLSLTINPATLASTAAYALDNPVNPANTSAYSLSGADAGKFDINEDTGLITSKPSVAITKANQSRYNFNVNYTANGVTHTESVTFTPNDAKQGSSALAAQESDRVDVFIDDLTKLSAFASSDGNNGSYQFGAAQGNDYQKFRFNSFGNIESRVPLDFNTQSQYVFDVKYLGSNGTFTDTVTLNLTDTLTASATLDVEEADQVTINAATLSSTVKYASENPVNPAVTAAYSLSGADANKFDIDEDTGVITSKLNQKILTSDKTTLNFNVLYTANGATHTEAITLNVSESLQSNSTLIAAEANKVSANLLQFTNLQNFMSKNGGGILRLASAGGANAGDHTHFTINSNINVIESNNALDFSTKPQYKFNVEYVKSDGTTFVETITLNLQDTLSSTATLTAEEAQSISIAPNVLSSTSSYAARNPVNPASTAAYSLSGVDADKFNIDEDTGVITSKNGTAITRQSKPVLNFNVDYTHGGVTHREAVSLTLTESLQAKSTLIAHEANKVAIQTSDLAKMSSFISRNPGGTVTIDPSSADAIYFQIDPTTGDITSKTALDYSQKSSYVFDVLYTTPNAVVFRESVTLNLGDTLKSSANLSAEVSDQLTIQAATLTSTAEYATQNPVNPALTSAYSLSGTDASKFNIDEDTGLITSANALKAVDVGSYSFKVLYNDGTSIHEESVNLDLTQAMQSTLDVSAQESGNIIIDKSLMTKMHEYASSDAYNGHFYLSSANGDHSKFAIDANNSVQSTEFLEFDTKPSFTFDINYVGGDGKVFTTTINLALLETLQAKASMAAEQAGGITIAFNQLSSTKAFATKYAGGTYYLSGADANKFRIDANGDIISTQSLLQNDQDSYLFDLNYKLANNTLHTETVNLKLTETMQATAKVIAAEATKVSVRSADLEYIYDYARRDNFGGQWNLDNTKQDANQFNILSDGTLVSKNAIDYNNQSIFDLGVKYTSTDGTQTFTQDITLNVTDTLTATARLKAEEAQSIAISENSLTATQQYKSQSAVKGKFSLSGQNDDFKSFSIDEDTGRIVAKNELRLSDKSNFIFDVNYTPNGDTFFTETINLELEDTTYDRSETTLSLKEAETANISFDKFENIKKFVEQNNSTGSFTLTTGADNSNDYTKFRVDSKGNIVSNEPLDFDEGKKELNFTLNFTLNSGRVYREQVRVNVLNDVRDDNTLDINKLDISSVRGAKEGVEILDQTLISLNETLAGLGASQNRVEHSIDNILSMKLKTELSLGRVIDADFATEAAILSREQILTDASTAMLAQAKTMKNSVLQLLGI